MRKKRGENGTSGFKREKGPPRIMQRNIQGVKGCVQSQQKERGKGDEERGVNRWTPAPDKSSHPRAEKGLFALGEYGTRKKKDKGPEATGKFVTLSCKGKRATGGGTVLRMSMGNNA